MNNCSNCKFFREFRFVEGMAEDFGECRFYAPTPGVNLGAAFQDRIAQWPVVDKAHWCGQYLGEKLSVAPIETQQAPDIPAAKKRAPRSIKKKAS